jgi:hypothetical protein
MMMLWWWRMNGNHDTGYTSSSTSGVLQCMPRHVRKWQGRDERMQSDGT